MNLLRSRNKATSLLLIFLGSSAISQGALVYSSWAASGTGVGALNGSIITTATEVIPHGSPSETERISYDHYIYNSSTMTSSPTLTFNFSTPVSNLLLNGISWRAFVIGNGAANPINYAFNHSFVVESGFAQATALNGNTELSFIGAATSFHGGVLKFNGPISTLSITATSDLDPNIYAASFNSAQSLSFAVETSAVPEPSTSLLIAFSSLGLLARRRKA